MASANLFDLFGSKVTLLPNTKQTVDNITFESTQTRPNDDGAVVVTHFSGHPRLNETILHEGMHYLKAMYVNMYCIEPGMAHDLSGMIFDGLIDAYEDDESSVWMRETPENKHWIVVAFDNTDPNTSHVWIASGANNLDFIVVKQLTDEYAASIGLVTTTVKPTLQ